MNDCNNTNPAATLVRVDLVELLSDLSRRLATEPATSNDASIVAAAVDYIAKLEVDVDRALSRSSGASTSDDKADLRELVSRMRDLNRTLVELVREKSRDLTRLAKANAKLARASARASSEVVAMRRAAPPTTTAVPVSVPRRCVAESAFDIDDGLDAQWFAWGICDAIIDGNVSRRVGPELEKGDPNGKERLALQRRSYAAGIELGRQLR
jgi:hypothetical protein